MQSWELCAREAIRDLVARYNANGDAGRIEPLLALFCEDAELELPDRSCRGRGEIRALFADVTARTRQGAARYVRHFTATLQIDLVDRERARGRCYYQTLTERGLDHWGRYLDEYRCVAGEWRFLHRRVTLDGSVAGGWAERMPIRTPHQDSAKP